jgi:phosphate transport system permease protein
VPSPAVESPAPDGVGFLVYGILKVNSHAMSANNTSDLPQVSDRLAYNAMRNWKESSLKPSFSVQPPFRCLTTLGIVYVLVSESISFSSHVSIVDFLTDTQWTPLFR